MGEHLVHSALITPENHFNLNEFVMHPLSVQLCKSSFSLLQ